VSDAFGLSQITDGYGYGYGWGAAPAFADVGGDGDADLFVGGGAGGESNGEIWYFENQGSTTVANFPDSAVHGDFYSGYTLVPVLGPVDGDADFDAFVGEAESAFSTLRYYRNDAGDFTPVALPTGLPAGGAWEDRQISMTLVDIDGDGDLDAFVSRTDYYDGNSILYFKNMGPPADPVFDIQGDGTLPNLAVPSGNYAFPTFVDIDADGDFDAFVGDQFGYIQFFRNSGTATSPSFDAALSSPFEISAVDDGPAIPAFMDIDADGDFDLFVGDGSGYTWFFENTNF
jgi:hypothetical protein